MKIITRRYKANRFPTLIYRKKYKFSRTKKHFSSTGLTRKCRSEAFIHVYFIGNVWSVLSKRGRY